MSFPDKNPSTHTLPNFSLDIPIFSKLYDFYKNLSHAITTFPKTKRYTLGQKLDNLTLEILELLFTMSNSNREQKIEILKLISAKLDLIKILLRLAKDTDILDPKTYLSLQEYLQEIGKMLGGWLRYFKNSKDTIATTEP